MTDLEYLPYKIGKCQRVRKLLVRKLDNCSIRDKRAHDNHVN